MESGKFIDFNPSIIATSATTPSFATATVAASAATLAPIDELAAGDVESALTDAGFPGLDVAIDDGGAEQIALRSRGTPRIANRLLRQVRDFAEVEREGKITSDVAADGLEFFGVDSRGLDKATRALLQSLCGMFEGGPVGLKTLAISVSEPVETVEDVYEPYLIQQGFLMRTPKGRVATAAAWTHLTMTPPATSPDTEAPPGLFD